MPMTEAEIYKIRKECADKVSDYVCYLCLNKYPLVKGWHMDMDGKDLLSNNFCDAAELRVIILGE